MENEKILQLKKISLDIFRLMDLDTGKIEIDGNLNRSMIKISIHEKTKEDNREIITKTKII